MFPQSSTIGWVSRLISLGLEKRLMTSEASTFIVSLLMLRVLAIAIPSIEAHNLARRQLEEPINLENPLIQEPFESLSSPAPPERFEPRMVKQMHPCGYQVQPPQLQLFLCCKSWLLDAEHQQVFDHLPKRAISYPSSHISSCRAGFGMLGFCISCIKGSQ